MSGRPKTLWIAVAFIIVVVVVGIILPEEEEPSTGPAEQEPKPMNLGDFVALPWDAMNVDEMFDEMQEQLSSSVQDSLEALRSMSASEWGFNIEYETWRFQAQLLGEFLVKAGQLGPRWVEGKAVSDTARDTLLLSFDEWEKAGYHLLLAIRLKDHMPSADSKSIIIRAK